MMGLPGDEDDQVLHEINVTPLVDVMLVLLVIFIIAAPLMARALQVDLPQVEAAMFQESTIMDLTVQSNGQWLLNGELLTHEQMESRLKQEMASSPSSIVRLSAAADTPYHHVAQVIAIAKRHDVKRLAFATQARP
ncbi:ExbD/TolR family protein [Magnetococcus sp. PR-3]|uniref:ExbD/TolR family protein n=1 Tax=Magnetococcus sp. PR-3 TaxID=3120355 RepID=UPI002FCDFE66